ncbi:3'-5' exonuclease [Microbacterium sp. HA-8]|uniref:3'-5' exonuclease n=1 Tax=Microbacterium sp. HA-8 TaxID=3234200 RepID=UPI0038F6455A
MAASSVFGAPLESVKRVASTDDGWSEALDQAGDDVPDAARNVTFMSAEYLQIILPNQLHTREQYFAARRPGRGVSLDRRKRDAVWSVVQAYRQAARRNGSLSYAEIAQVAAAYLNAASAAKVADHVLIDEAQDLSPSQWQLLRALVPDGQNDLFIADDTHQRIYGQRVVLSRYDIKVTGRSRRLTLNYRTTQQNLGYALGVLSGAEYVDAEETVESGGAYRSSRRGPAPRAVASKSRADQDSAVEATVTAWLDEGAKPETIAVLARSQKLRDHVARLLSVGDVKATAAKDVDDIVDGRVVCMTMHSAKGMEFSRVLLYDVSEGAIPNMYFYKDVAQEDMPDKLLQERSLLYVAASRARDELVVTWAGKPSQLLVGGA